MMELRTPKGSFDLSPDAEISIVTINNALSWNSNFEIDRSDPFTLPWTDINAVIWENADQPETYTNKLSIDCQLIIEGALEYKGTLYLLRAIPGEKYEVSLSNKNAGTYAEKKLSELNWPYYGEYIPELQIYRMPEVLGDILGGKYPEYMYTMPQYKQRLEDSGGVYDFVNYWDPDTPQMGGYATFMYYVGTVLDRIAADMGIVHTGSFKNDIELQKLILFNVHLLLDGAGAVVMNRVEIAEPITPAWFMPNATVSELINTLRTRFGIGAHVDMTQGKLHIYTLREVMGKADEIDITENLIGTGIINYEAEKQAGSYAQPYDSTDGNSEYIKEKEPASLKGSVDYVWQLAALSATANKDDAYLVAEDDFYWKFDGATWTQYQYRYLKYNIGKGSTINEASASVITTAVFDTQFGMKSRMPYTNYRTEDVMKNNVEVPITLLIYHGMRSAQTPDPREYPYASIDNRDADKLVIGEMELRDDGEYGQYERYNKYRNDFLHNIKTPTVYIKDSYVAKQITPDKKIRIKANSYLLREKTATYNLKGMVRVELKMAKI
jgi:hypothetical protein